MINYEISFLIAVFSFVYIVILTEPHQIFNSTYKKLDLFFNAKRNKEGKTKHWLFKIIIGCEKCNAGQISFWLHLYMNWIDYIIDPGKTLLIHLSFITFTILLTVIITHTHKLIEKWLN